MQEAERGPMKKDWEIYRDTGILGGYRPEQGILRRTEDGNVESSFRDGDLFPAKECTVHRSERRRGFCGREQQRF